MCSDCDPVPTWKRRDMEQLRQKIAERRKADEENEKQFGSTLCIAATRNKDASRTNWWYDTLKPADIARSYARVGVSAPVRPAQPEKKKTAQLQRRAPPFRWGAGFGCEEVRAVVHSIVTALVEERRDEKQVFTWLSGSRGQARSLSDLSLVARVESQVRFKQGFHRFPN